MIKLFHYLRSLIKKKPPLPSEESQTIDWFFALNDTSKTYLEMSKVAVLSAERFRINKYCIYSGDTEEYVDFLEQHHVTVIRHQFSLAKELKEMRPDQYNIGTGSYLRVDIPEVILNHHLPVGEYFLYTDCDVMFLNDPVDQLSKLKPKTIAASSEHSMVQTHYFNTGVMWVNLSEAQRASAKIKESIIKHKFSFESFEKGPFDQGVLNHFYGKRYDYLDKRFNWKPYWGRSNKAFIIHFHGPKPEHYRHYISTKQFLDPVCKHFFTDQTTESYDFYVNKFYNLLKQD